MEKPNIVVLAGGWSDEREISLKSGKSVFTALNDAHYSVSLLDYQINDKNTLETYIKKKNISLVFNLMHGEGGEDGVVQKQLDSIGVRYIGSGAQASELSFNKVETKSKWLDAGLSTPKFCELSSVTAQFIQGLSQCDKVVIKPKSSGSSVGIKIIDCKDLNLLNKSDFLDSIFKVYQKSIEINEYFIEYFVYGGEYTAPIIHDEVFPIIKIETEREFYDFKAKYEDNNTSFLFPEFEKDTLARLQKTALKAFKSLGCSDWGRVDFFLDKKMNMSLIEVNSIPGMTDHSLVPMSAAKKGLDYLSLIKKLIIK